MSIANSGGEPLCKYEKCELCYNYQQEIIRDDENVNLKMLIFTPTR